MNYLKKIWVSLFPHQKTVRYVLSVFVLALLAAFATKCRADDSVLFEGGVQYLRGPAATMLVGLQYDGPSDSTIEPGLFLVGRTDAGRGVMGGQVLLVDGFGRLDLGIGLAAMNADHHQLGSRINFALMVRYNIGRSYVAVRHFSNAGTTAENTGIDLVTFGWRF